MLYLIFIIIKIWIIIYIRGMILRSWESTRRRNHKPWRLYSFGGTWGLEARAKAFLHRESYSKLERRGKPINAILLSFQWDREQGFDIHFFYYSYGVYFLCFFFFSKWKIAIFSSNTKHCYRLDLILIYYLVFLTFLFKLTSHYRLWFLEFLQSSSIYL
jgi:hypothetical protein